MNVLPEKIAVVDSNLQPVRCLRRRDAEDYREADFDRMIVAHVDMIGSALRSAELLEDGGELRVIAQKNQVAKIDVLCAEVVDDELSRLVLFEMKLFKNPESRRTVLAQLLEYANTLQFDVSIEEIFSKAEGSTRAWLEGQRDVLERLKARGDFLLVICGDRIHPRLIEIAKPMLDRRRHALSSIELALVSLAIYEGDGMKLVVPNLVGAVTRGQRDMCIEVTVRTNDGLPIPVSMAITDADAHATPTRSQPWNEERFLAAVTKAVADSQEKTWEPAIRELLAFVDQTLGLAVRWGRGGDGTFHIDVERAASSVGIAWIDVSAWAQLHRARFAKVLGEDRATQRVAKLAADLGIAHEVKSSAHTPYLGTDENYFDMREPDQLRTFLRWLIEMRDELLAAQSNG